jgi:hypothetical protein
MVTRILPRRLWPALLLFLVLTQLLVADPGLALPSAVAVAATAAVGAALVGCALSTARAVPAVPHQRVRTTLRDRERRTAFLPQRDPDARGRTRPRAPGRRLPAAA